MAALWSLWRLRTSKFIYFGNFALAAPECNQSFLVQRFLRKLRLWRLEVPDREIEIRIVTEIGGERGKVHFHYLMWASHAVEAAWLKSMLEDACECEIHLFHDVPKLLAKAVQYTFKFTRRGWVPLLVRSRAMQQVRGSRGFFQGESKKEAIVLSRRAGILRRLMEPLVPGWIDPTGHRRL